MNRIIFCALLFTIFGIGTEMFGETSEQMVRGEERELILSYFPKPFVQKTLKEHGVQEEKWDVITNVLADKDLLIVQIVEEKAELLDQNPLQNLANRDEAVKIFRETLFEVFRDTLIDQGITDESQIKVMLDDIQRQKASYFRERMQRVHSEKALSLPEDANEENSEYDLLP